MARTGLLWSVALLIALPAAAIDKTRSATAMAQRAAADYEAGRYDQAMRLYLQAFAATPAVHAYLFAAARAEHLASALEQAEKHYRQYMELASAATDEASRKRLESAGKYLQQLESARSEAMVAQADGNAAAGHDAVAAGLYLQVFKLAPDRPGLLFRAGRAEFKAGHHDAARPLLEQFLRAPGASPAEASEAQVYLDQMTERLAVPAVVQAVIPPPPQSRAVLRWSLVGAAGAVAVGGIAVYALALVRHGQLQQDLALVDGRVTGAIDYDTASARAEPITTLRTVGVVATGAGIAAAAIAWWWLADPTPEPAGKVQFGFGPTPASAAIALRF